jgi:muramoyltetrapeptide carboxypeptidase
MIKINKTTDKIAFIAPASGYAGKCGKIDIEKSKARLLITIEFYEASGFNCVYDREIFCADSLGYFAAPREKRLNQLKNALLDPQVKIIAAFRGGYGSTEIIFDCLDINPTIPKIFIGFSDITAIHFLFNQKYKLPTIHGAMGIDHKTMIEEIFFVLDGKEISFNLSKINKPSKEIGKISGEIVGGNLSLICNMIGTSLHPNLDSKIIFLEDINEKGYQIHRSLMHMKNSGLFEGVKAIIFGDFSNSDDYAEETLRDFSNSHIENIPAFLTSGIGHGQINYPVVIGAKAKIDSDILKIHSPFKLV